MLNKLTIRNYALIDNLDISFTNGLNILTGETGAGKSIILGALSLILGQRAESRYFFDQQKKCVIEGAFILKEYGLHQFFMDNDLDYADETIIRREIASDGRSRAFINDTPVNLGTLRSLSERLIDIHSQHATLDINNEDFQLLVVDVIAGHSDLLKLYQQQFITYKKDVARLRELNENAHQAKADLDYFQFQFDELEKAKLIANEEQHLEQELLSLNNAEEIKRNLLNASYNLNESETAIALQLKETIGQLQSIEKFNPTLSELTERLRSSLIELKDIGSEIEHIEQVTIVNEARVLELNERLDLIYSLQQKHRVNTAAELLNIQSELSDKLNTIGFIDEDIEKLTKEVEEQKARLLTLAKQLSANRKAAIPKIEKQVVTTLTEVGMPASHLKIEHTLYEQDKFDITGLDQIKFLFSANKGHQLAPINKVASGGELSRLMLSIKSLIAQHTALPTIIFDEIDTGISGEVALRVGSIMEKLAGSMQVIAITHLPQIASKGNAHYFVYKNTKANSTQTNIRKLDHTERITEIAKMLSGDAPGVSALQNARELLKNN